MADPAQASNKEVGRPATEANVSPAHSLVRPIAALADEYLLLLIMLVVMARPFISGRTFDWSNTWFQIAWFTCGGIWLARCAGKGKLPFRHPLSIGLFAGFVAVCAVTLATGVSVNDTYRALCEMFGYLLAMYLAMNAVSNWQAARRVVIAIVFVSVLVSLNGYIQRVYTLEYGRLEFLEKEDLFRRVLIGPVAQPFWERMQVNRIFSTFLYPPAFAGYLIVCIPLTFGLMAAYRSLRGLAVSATAFCVQLTALLLTVTRGAWLAVAISSCVMAVFAWHDRAGLRERTVRVAAALTIATVVAVGLWVSSDNVARALSPVPKSAPEIAEPAAMPEPEASETAPTSTHPDLSGKTMGMDDLMFAGSFMARLTYWQGALRMFAARPILGIGWNAFARVYPKHMILGGWPVTVVHNDYLQVLAETGLIGFALYAAFWIVTIIGGVKLSVNSDSPAELRWLRTGMLCAIISFLLHSLVDFDLYIPGIALNVFFLAGLMLGTAQREPRQMKFNWLRAAAGIALLVFAVGLSFCPYWADRIFSNKVILHGQVAAADAMFTGTPVKWEDAALLLSREDIELIQSGRISRDKQFDIILRRLDAVKRRIATAEAIFRFDPKFAGYQGTLDYIAAHSMVNPVRYTDSAIRHYKRAMELDPTDFTLHLLLARANIQRGNYSSNSDTERRMYYTRALQQFEAATKCYPNNPEIWREWGNVYIGMGQQEKGRQLIERADQLQPYFKVYG